MWYLECLTQPSLLGVHALHAAGGLRQTSISDYVRLSTKRSGTQLLVPRFFNQSALGCRSISHHKHQITSLEILGLIGNRSCEKPVKIWAKIGDRSCEKMMKGKTPLWDEFLKNYVTSEGLLSTMFYTISSSARYKVSVEVDILYTKRVPSLSNQWTPLI